MLRGILLRKRGQTGNSFVCHVREGLDEDTHRKWREACKKLDHYAEFEGEGYCVLHYPGEDKEDDFEEAKQSKLARQDYDFRGAIFPEGTSDFEGYEFDANVDFTGAAFSGTADFRGTQFRGERTYFRGTQFSGERTIFLEAQFSGAWTDFAWAQFRSGNRTYFKQAHFSSKCTAFSRAHFRSERTTFSEAHFCGALTTFRGAQFHSERTSFRDTTFTRKVDFSRATFRERVVFWATPENQDNHMFGSQAWAWFDLCRIDSKELLEFNTVLLHPGWFINADVRSVNFTDVKWYGMPGGPKGTLDEEIAALTKGTPDVCLDPPPRYSSPHTLLAQACRRLSANMEENREYPRANEFHYWSMDALRKEGWSRLGLIGIFYWALSGYGVRARRALGVLLSIAVVFAVLYMLLGPNALQVSSASNAVHAMEHAGQALV